MGDGIWIRLIDCAMKSMVGKVYYARPPDVVALAAGAPHLVQIAGIREYMILGQKDGGDGGAKWEECEGPQVIKWVKVTGPENVLYLTVGKTYRVVDWHDCDYGIRNNPVVINDRGERSYLRAVSDNRVQATWTPVEMDISSKTTKELCDSVKEMCDELHVADHGAMGMYVAQRNELGDAVEHLCARATELEAKTQELETKVQELEKTKERYEKVAEMLKGLTTFIEKDKP